MDDAIGGRECRVVEGSEGVWGDFKEEDGEGSERSGVEESGGEGGFSGGEEVGEAFEDGHLVDEFVHVRDVGGSGEADAGEKRVGTNC